MRDTTCSVPDALSRGRDCAAPTQSSEIPNKVTDVSSFSSFGGNLRAIRLSRGYSQRDLERLTGIKRCYFSRFETGYTSPSTGYTSTPSAETLCRIADALNVPVGELLANYADAIREAMPGLSERDVQFLADLAPYLHRLTGDARRSLLELMQKFAEARA